MNSPYEDDRVSTAVEDRLVSLSCLAKTERMEHAETVFDAPDDSGPEDLPTMQAAWAWLWENDRTKYHSLMEQLILDCPDHLINELLEIP